jgi:hypothetical protein
LLGIFIEQKFLAALLQMFQASQQQEKNLFFREKKKIHLREIENTRWKRVNIHHYIGSIAPWADYQQKGKNLNPSFSIEGLHRQKYL